MVNNENVNIMNVLLTILIVWVLYGMADRIYEQNKNISRLNDTVKELKITQDSIKTYMQLDIRVLEEKVELLNK